MSQSRPAFLDALPDLVIGLVGIPVAISAQGVAQVALEETGKGNPRQVEGLIYFALILVLYGLASVGMLMVFEGDHVTAVNEHEWQARLIMRLVLMVPVAFVFTITLIAVGVSYDKGKLYLLYWEVAPSLMMLISCATNILLTCLALRSRVKNHYPTAQPFWVVVQLMTLNIAIGVWLQYP